MRPRSSFEGPRVEFKASQYLRRISYYGNVSPSCLVVGLIYLERLQEQCPKILLTPTTLRRLLLVVILAAAKYLEDVTYLNSYW